MKPSDDSTPDDIEIELLQEKAFPGSPKKVAPEEGIASMEKRLEFLRAELRRWWAQAAEEDSQETEVYAREMAGIRKQIDDTEARLKEYRLQRDGLN